MGAEFPNGQCNPGGLPFGYAGNFNGDVNVTGTLYAGTKDFRIDHPLDPANKYLVHASVESSEMVNVYSGNIATDAQGEATVRLPEWFEALNTDFRYQLTVIGQFAQAIVAREIQDHQFQIRTNVGNVKVSWQVTGARRDAFPGASAGGGDGKGSAIARLLPSS
jgi:trimeric autotransporter adhesin